MLYYAWCISGVCKNRRLLLVDLFFFFSSTVLSSLFYLVFSILFYLFFSPFSVCIRVGLVVPIFFLLCRLQSPSHSFLTLGYFNNFILFIRPEFYFREGIFFLSSSIKIRTLKRDIYLYT